MAEQKILLVVDAKDIEQMKSGINTLNDMVQQLLNDRLENADTYLTSEEAGRAFARELLGKPMTPEDIAIEQAENCYVPYSGDDF